MHGTLALALALAAVPGAHAADLPPAPPAAVAPAATGTGADPQVAPGIAASPTAPEITAGAAPELVSPLAAPPATIAPPATATASPAVTAQPTATQPTTAAQQDAGPPPAAAPQAAAQPATAPGEAGQQPSATQPPAGATAPVLATPATPAAPAIIAPPPPPPPPMPPVHFDAALGVPKNRYGKLIYQTALRYALNPLLMAAIMRAESDFNPRARSRKGALGLMQVLPATGRRFGVARRRDLLNPRKNIETAGRYLRWLVDRFGEDPVRILAAYNAGEGAVDRFGGVPPFAETRDYVQRILGYLGFTAALLDAPVTATAAAVAGSAIPAAGSK